MFFCFYYINRLIFYAQTSVRISFIDIPVPKASSNGRTNLNVDFFHQ